MMREENLYRLKNVKLNSNSRDHIVMYYLIRDLKAAIEKYAAGDVLDIGCGNKPYEELFPSSLTKYVGCDVVQSDEMKVDVICEATHLKFEDGAFDTVFSTQVIEHVSDPLQMLKEANRVLKPGGILILSAPFSWELHEEPYDFYRFSKYGLEYMLERNGFHVLEIKANGGKWAAIAQLKLNIIYSSFPRKTIYTRILEGIFVKLRFTTLYNKIAIWRDKKYYDELLTLNYVVVAKKLS